MIRENLLRQLGNKTREQLDKELDEIMIRHEQELGDVISENAKMRSILLVPFNIAFLYGFLRSSKRILKINQWYGKKVNNSIKLGFLFSTA